MSTRATYRIQEFTPHENRIEYFYIQYDGYPAGAAEYFQKLLVNMESLKETDPYSGNVKWRPGKAIVAFGMLKYAEFTEDHEYHGDTEYRYNLYFDRIRKTWDIVAYGRENKFFDDTLDNFIEKYTTQAS